MKTNPLPRTDQITKVDIGQLRQMLYKQPDMPADVAHGVRIVLANTTNFGDYASFLVYGPEAGTPEIIIQKAELLRFAKEVISKLEPGSTEKSGRTQEEIDAEVGRRVNEYRKYWNPETGMFEIDLGTKSEWICTEDELYDDVRRSVEEDGE